MASAHSDAVVSAAALHPKFAFVHQLQPPHGYYTERARWYTIFHPWIGIVHSGRNINIYDRQHHEEQYAHT
jgi:hypothetical protein